MQALDDIQVLQLACEATNRWGLYVNIFIPDDLPLENRIDEVLKAASFLNLEEHSQLIFDEHGWVLFDTQEEMEDAYWRCIGDDGPNDINPYDGPVSVYALTCDPTGQTLNENT